MTQVTEEIAREIAQDRLAIVAAELRALELQPVPGMLVLGQPVNRVQLSAAFDMVADKVNWKNPINCHAALTGSQVAMIYAAVQFYAGCSPTFSVLAGRVEFDAKGNPFNSYHVKAKGYYAAVGA